MAAAEAGEAAQAAAEVAAEELVAGEWAGSVLPMADPMQIPPGYPIKGNNGSLLYHEPGTRYYDATVAELWFRSVDAAEGAGFSAPGGGSTADADEPETAEPETDAAETPEPETAEPETAAVDADEPEPETDAAESEGVETEADEAGEDT